MPYKLKINGLEKIITSKIGMIVALSQRVIWGDITYFVVDITTNFNSKDVVITLEEDSKVVDKMLLNFNKLNK